MSGTRGSRSLCVLVSIVLLILAAERADAAGMLVPRDGGPPIQVRSHRVSVELADGLAKTTLRQTFINTHGRSLEAIYVFPLPRDAALVDVAMEVGGQRLEGLLIERSQARKIYDDIVRSQRDPALVEKIGHGRFRLSVFPVLPRQKTIVELTWIQQVSLDQGSYRYVYPLALAGTAEKTRQDFTFSLNVDSTVPLTAVTSSAKDMKIQVAGDARTAKASFERRGARLDRDILVEAAVAVAEPTLTVRTFHREKGHGFFLAIVTPPAAKPEDLVPRDVVLLLDTSGSMRGDKLVQAQTAARHLVKGLRDVDRVNAVGFGSDLQRFAEAPVPATGENREKLDAFLAGLTAGGTTGLGNAMKDATSVAPSAGRVRTVILLTDGRPTAGETEATRIVELARNGGKKGLRIFCFGVGEDANPPLLDSIGHAGSGGSEVLETTEDVTQRLTRFLERTASPVLSDIEIEIEGAKTYDVFPRPIPNACLGRQIVIAGRYREGGEHEVRIRATLGSQKTQLTRKVEFAAGAAGARSVMHLFAARKLAYLEDEMRARSGLSDAAYFAAIDSGDSPETDEVIDEMIRTSLECGVHCVYTSFLVLLPEDRWRIDPEDMEALAKAKERADDAKQDAGSAEEGSPAPVPDTGGENGPAAAPPATDPEGTRPPEKPDAPDTPPPDRPEDPPPPDSGEDEGREPPPNEEERPPPDEEENPPPDGNHRGPAGEDPPGERHPNDPPPEGSGGEPASGGSGDDAGGDGGNEETPPPTAPVAPPAATGGGLGGGAPVGPGGKRRRSAAPRADDWADWWRLNRASILAATAGRGVHRTHPPADPKTIEDLRKLVTDGTATAELQGAAALALGRIGGPGEHPTLVDALRTGSSSLAIPAALALGVAATPGPAVRSALLETIRDRQRDVRIRIAAILALGLMQDESPAVILELFSRLDGTESDDQVPAAALFALGLIGDEGFVPRLCEWLKTDRIGRRRLGPRESAAIVDALGRIRHRRSAAVLAEALRGGEPEVQRSAAIALGRIVPRLPEDEQARQVRFLVRYRQEQKDRWVRNYLTVALGRIAASEETYPRIRKAIVDQLVKDLRTDRRQAGSGFLCPALGLAARGCNREDQTRIRIVLQQTLPEMRRADISMLNVPIGLALAGEVSPDTAEVLIESVRRRWSVRLRSGSATAIGLLELRAGEPELRKLLGSGEDPDLTVAAAAAAGLVGDPATIDVLIRGLKSKQTLDSGRREMAIALARMAHANSAPALRAVLLHGPTDPAKAAAALALGHLHARAGTVPLYRLSEDLNHNDLGRAMLAVLTWE